LLDGTTFDEDVYNGTSLTSFLQTFGVGDQLPTNFNWIASSPADYSVAADWSPSGVPNGASIVVNFTNNVTCNYSAGDNHSLSQMFLGPLDNSTGKFSMGGGTLSITNGAGAYSLILGGNGSSLTTTTGANSVGNFTMSGGTLNVVRNSNTNLYQDSFMLGLGTNSTGTFTLSGGVANFLCGIEIGVNGSGILNVSGGTLIDNGWFHVGSGASKAGGMGSGTFNLTGGTVYILPNIGSPPTEAANNGGLAINQADTNAVVNISGGTLYCCRIGLDGNTGIPSTGSTDTLNISGGSIYVGYGGVGSNDNVAVGNQIQSVNISGGTFHTADILQSGIGGANGAITNVLTDGTNWTWGVTPPVNLATSIPGMDGVGYVTFAPETNCTISLKNVWSGQGGIKVAGPGQVKLAGTNTYTGNTTLSGGELSLTGGGAIGNSPEIIVASGATFDVSGLLNTNIVAGFTNIFLLASGQTLIGSGTVNGTLSAGSGATIAPGSSTAIGTLTNTGSTLLQGGGTLTVKVQNATTGAGVGNDDLAVSGNIGVLATTGNKFTVKLVSLKGTGAAGNVTNFNNTVGYAWTIATGTVTNFNAGAFTVDASGFSNPLGGGQFFVSNLGNSLVLYFDPAGTAGGMGGSISNPGMNGNRNPTFSGFGIPGYTYGVESETNLITGPWIEAGTVMAGTNNGSWSFTDTNQNNPPTIYYRLYYPDNPGNPPP
jgi:hypothetical protein